MTNLVTVLADEFYALKHENARLRENLASMDRQLGQRPCQYNLCKEYAKRGKRMEAMRKEFQRQPGYPWEVFLEDNPQAETWFDEDGIAR